MFGRKRKASDFSAEIEAHLQHEAERLREQGLSEEEARVAARRAFGNVLQAEERFYEAGRWLWWDHLWQDVRFGIRMLARNPGFAMIAVVTLALGIAINATMFSMVSGFLLTRPSAREPDRVVAITSVSPAPEFLADAYPISAPNYLEWRQANRTFADVAAADESRTVSLGGQDRPEAVRSAAVSPNYFSVLGVSPQIGRTFLAGEDQPGRDHVVVLSHDLWVRRFGADRSILSRTIRLNRENYDIIGVMPEDFRLLGFTPQLWTPLALSAADQTAAARNKRSLYVFARLKPGVTVEQARAEAATLARRAASNFPETEKGWSATARTLPDFLIYIIGIRKALAVLMTTVGFVLLIACANVAGLLLARGERRRKELAIRISLGARRLRIIRQLLTEGFVIALLGGGTGLLLSYWGIRAVRANMTFNEVINAVPIRLDWNVALFALGLSVACAVACAVVPALKAARTDPNPSLKDESRAASAGKSHTRLRSVMVTGEITLALFLLIGTGLLMRGIYLIEHQRLGFEAGQLLTAGVSLDEARYGDAAKRNAFVEDVLRRIKQIPGAEAAAAASDLPATSGSNVVLQLKDQPELQANQRPSILDVVVSPDYFRTAGIPLVRGRTFMETDKAEAPRVFVVNQEFVRRFMDNQEPLGKQIGLNVSGATSKWGEIVGIVGNVKTYSEMTLDDPEVYEAFLQRPVASLSLMVRTTTDPSGLASAVRNAVGQVDTELPLSRVESMHAVIEEQKAGNPFFTRVLVSFAVLALVLAAIGIYGLIAYSVGHRTHEIGIRMALGAERWDVLRMILWQGLKLTAIGAAIGLMVAAPLPRVFGSIFYGFYVSELGLYVIVPAAIVLIAMLATYLPARRALMVEPSTALRHE